jgi:hypothetical protein
METDAGLTPSGFHQFLQQQLHGHDQQEYRKEGLDWGQYASRGSWFLLQINHSSPTASFRGRSGGRRKADIGEPAFDIIGYLQPLG